MTVFAQYSDYDALGLAELVKRGEVTALELWETAVALIDEANPVLNCVVHAHFDLARKQIEAGLPDGPFRGVPFLLKNTGFEVKDMLLSTGARLFRDMVSTRDGTLAARYKAAGLVILGKTNTPEFALSFATEPREFGPTRNPWSLDHGPGGSSGGSSAAVAAGIVPIANSSDGAGSTRLPASHCGLFGFKPSRMRNPLGPVAVEGIAGMSTPHALSWTVRDNAALLDVSAGADIGDPYAAPEPSGTYLAAVSQVPRRLKIGLTLNSPLGTHVDPEIVATVREAALFLENLGHHVEEVADAGYDAHALKAAWRVIAGVNVAPAVIGRGAALAIDDPASQLEPVNEEWVREGMTQTGMAYLKAINQLHATARGLGSFFGKYDLLLSPSTGELAPRIGEMAGSGIKLDAFYDRFWSHGPFTAAFNASGFPAMSVPFGASKSGLPIGIHFGAAFGQDELLFSLAGEIERARPWIASRPSYQAGKPRPAEGGVS